MPLCADNRKGHKMADGSIIIDANFNKKELENQLGKLNGIVEKGMSGAKVAIGSIATAITGLGASAVKFGTDYQKASNKMMAATGSNMYEIENLNNVLKNVYADNFGEDMNDVANAITNVSQQIKGLNDTDLQTVTEYALGLRDTFGYDVSESVRTAKTLMDNFGVSGQQAYSLIAQGAQQGLDYSGELLDNIDEYSVQFGKLGFSAEDMFNIFASGAENGAFNLDKIGDAVKEFSIRAIDGSNTTIEGFTKLGLNADEMAQKFANGGDTAKNAFYEVIQRIGEMDNAVEQSKVGVDLFGTMWEDLGPEVVTQLGSIQGAFDQTYDTMEDINAIQYNDLGSALQGIGREIQTNLLLPISDKLLPIFSDLANKLSDAFSSGEIQGSIDKIADAIGNLVTGVTGFVEKWLPTIIDFVSWVIQNAPTIISLLAGIGVGLKVFQVAKGIASFVTAFKNASTAVKGVSGAFKAFNAVLKSNPIILIVSIIATLVTALITLWNTNEDFRNAVIGIWEAIKNAFKTVIDAIIGFFTETIPNAFQGFIDFWTNLGENIKNLFINAWNSIVSFFTETIPAWIQSIITWFQQLPYNIGLLIGQIIGHIIQFGVNAWNWVTTELPKIIQGIVQWFSELPGKIWNWLVNVVKNVIQWGLEMRTKASTAISNMITAVINWFKQLPGEIWNWLVNTVNNIVKWGSDMVAKGKKAASDLVTNIVNTIKNLPKKIVEIGKNIVEGLWNGIKSMVSWIKDKISGFLGGIVDGVKGVLGIHSPSKVFNKEVGRYMAMGIGEGFDDNLNKVFRQMKTAVDFETQKLSANLSTTATNNKLLTANITLNPSNVYMDSDKVGRIVAPAVTKTLRGAGAY